MVSLSLGILFHLVYSSIVFGQFNGSESVKQTMTTYLQYDLSTDTYESNAASSKETAVGGTITFATAAGIHRDVGISLKSSKNSVKFSLNNNSMEQHFRDLLIHYRLGWVYPAITASLSEIAIEKTNGEYVDIYRSTFGAGIAVVIPMMDKFMLSTSFKFFQKPELPKFSDLLNSANAVPEGERHRLNANLGSRNEFDIGTSIDIAREYLDFTCGYRINSYTIDIESKPHKESQSGPYAGIRLGAYF